MSPYAVGPATFVTASVDLSPVCLLSVSPPSILTPGDGSSFPQPASALVWSPAFDLVTAKLREPLQWNIRVCTRACVHVERRESGRSTLKDLRPEHPPFSWKQRHQMPTTKAEREANMQSVRIPRGEAWFSLCTPALGAGFRPGWRTDERPTNHEA